MSAARIIRQHNCSRTHPTFRALARCLWPEARWVLGEGPYATLLHCGPLTVVLHPTEQQAERAVGFRYLHPFDTRHLCELRHDLAVLALALGEDA